MKVLFLDAYNLIYRSLSGFKSGENYVVYNFFRSLRPLIELHNPDKVYFVLEGRPEHRTQLSEGSYKSNRKSQGDSFHRQKASIINIIKSCFPFTITKHPKLECDDTIATLAQFHSRMGHESIIVSSDSDFIQLLNLQNLNISLYHPIKKTYIERPDYDYVMWKALRGDATDNIRGIPGVGDKTAHKLVSNPTKLKEFLLNENNRSIFERNVNLIRLVDFTADLSVLETFNGVKDFDMLKNIFTDLDFKTILKEKAWKKYVDTFARL